jgi:hypothetical protein
MKYVVMKAGDPVAQARALGEKAARMGKEQSGKPGDHPQYRALEREVDGFLATLKGAEKKRVTAAITGSHHGDLSNWIFDRYETEIGGAG